MIDKVVQISDFKKNPSRFLEEVAGGMPITITQGRKANAILVPRDMWARLLIRLQELEDELEIRELLADPKVQQRLSEGLPGKRYSAGRGEGTTAFTPAALTRPCYRSHSESIRTHFRSVLVGRPHSS